jgi:hypothetical protein
MEIVVLDGVLDGVVVVDFRDGCRYVGLRRTACGQCLRDDVVRCEVVELAWAVHHDGVELGQERGPALDAASMVGFRRGGIAHPGDLDHGQRVDDREEGLRPVDDVLGLLYRAYLSDHLLLRDAPGQLRGREGAGDELLRGAAMPERARRAPRWRKPPRSLPNPCATRRS